MPGRQFPGEVIVLCVRWYLDDLRAVTTSYKPQRCTRRYRNGFIPPAMIAVWRSKTTGFGKPSSKMNGVRRLVVLRVCLCCGADGHLPEHPSLPFCRRCVSGRCLKCRSWVRVSIWRLNPKAINLIGRSPGPRMPCGWDCGAKLTTSQMRRHFTECPLRPTVREAQQLPPKPNLGGRPPGPRMACGWHCGMQLTATQMRRHFVQCRCRPKVSAGGVCL